MRREVVERALEQVRRQYGFFVTGYLVMPEHVHLLVSEPEQADHFLLGNDRLDDSGDQEPKRQSQKISQNMANAMLRAWTIASPITAITEPFHKV